MAGFGEIKWPVCPNGCAKVRFHPAPAHCPECDWEFSISEEQERRLEKHRKALSEG